MHPTSSSTATGKEMACLNGGSPFLQLGGLFEQDDVDAALRVMQAAATPSGSFFPLPEENDFQKAFAAHEGQGRQWPSIPAAQRLTFA